MTEIFNVSKHTELRRKLRNDMTNPEALLWSRLKSKQLHGFKFRRQYGIGPYVVDFYCSSARLAIEIDGDSHFQDGVPEADAERQSYIESVGVTFLRFTNIDVMSNLDGVLYAISEWLSSHGADLL